MNDLRLMIRGFKFNNRHNHDEGVVMHSKSIDPPSKKKIKEPIPFTNGSYDFSTVGSSGEITYNERQITIVLGLPSSTKEALQDLYTRTLEWLMDVGKSQLIFDDVIGYYYMAEVESASTFDQVMSFGKLTVTFVAEPFKTSTEYEGSDVWDIFNFEEDMVQDMSYTVTGTSVVSIYNKGRVTTPKINCSAPMSVVVSGKTYSLATGDNTFYGMKLKNGVNEITVTGDGIIKFIFQAVRI